MTNSRNGTITNHSVLTQAEITPQVNTQDFSKAIVTGGIAGCLSATVTFPIDKITVAYQTMCKTTSPSFYEAARTAFEKRFAGYFFALTSAFLKNIFMFPAKTFFETKLDEFNPNCAFNKNLAGFFAALVSVYIMSPITVMKALRYHNRPMAEIWNLPLKRFVDGAFTTGLCNGFQFGGFCGFYPFLKKHTDNPILAGVGANVLSAFGNNWLSTIAMNQRVFGGSLTMQAKRLYEEGGISRFYRGFFKTTVLRMGAQGAVTGAAIEIAEKLYTKNKNNSPKDESNSAPKPRLTR